MHRIADRWIPSELSEITEPSRTAIVLVDPQNDYVTAGGSIDVQTGGTPMVPAFKAIVPHLQALLNAAREAGVLIIYLQQTQLPGLINESPSRMHALYINRGLSPDVERCREGSWGWQFADEVAPQAGDVVVQKWRSTGFVGTSLDVILSANEIRTLVVTGVATDGCVFATALHGFFNDYFIVLPENCVAGSDEESVAAAFKMLENWISIIPEASAITAGWARATQPARLQQAS